MRYESKPLTASLRVSSLSLPFFLRSWSSWTLVSTWMESVLYSIGRRLAWAGRCSTCEISLKSAWFSTTWISSWDWASTSNCSFGEVGGCISTQAADDLKDRRLWRYISHCTRYLSNTCLWYTALASETTFRDNKADGRIAVICHWLLGWGFFARALLKLWPDWWWVVTRKWQLAAIQSENPSFLEFAQWARMTDKHALKCHGNVKILWMHKIRWNVAQNVVAELN